MNKIILKLKKEKFSFFKYFLFTYLKYYKIYEKNVVNDVFFIPIRKSLKNSYIKALSAFLKSKNISQILVVDDEIKDTFKTEFSIIYGKNTYRTMFCDVLSFLAENKLFNYEIVFLSDNIKEIKEYAENCVKKVKSISVLTQKPYLYESMRDYFLLKYGVMINIKTKKEKLKKHNKIYVNAGGKRVFEKSTFKNVVLLDIFNVYEAGFCHIILENNKLSKEYTKLLKCSHTAGLAEFLEEEKKGFNLKIVNIKK